MKCTAGAPFKDHNTEPVLISCASSKMYSHGGFGRSSGCTLQFPSTELFPSTQLSKLGLPLPVSLFLRNRGGLVNAVQGFPLHEDTEWMICFICVSKKSSKFRKCFRHLIMAFSKKITQKKTRVTLTNVPLCKWPGRGIMHSAVLYLTGQKCTALTQV